jgi:hypothetical protein
VIRIRVSTQEERVKENNNRKKRMPKGIREGSLINFSHLTMA